MGWTTAILYLLLAPVAGGLLSGLDRILTARLQGRVGPPVWQPFADVFKLFEKQNLAARRTQTLYVWFFCLAAEIAGVLLFAGFDLLLAVFALALAGVFFVLAGYKASSPYSFVGAERELLQMMAYEPPLLLAAVGLYLATGSFIVRDIAAHPALVALSMPGVLLALVFALFIKLRKSPFDLSTSHHGHQELVKGLTTEFSGPTLGLIEIAHWYENVFVLALVYLFFASAPALGLLACLAAYFLAVLADNVCARVKWQAMLASTWLVALVLGLGNILVVFYLNRP